MVQTVGWCASCWAEVVTANGCCVWCDTPTERARDQRPRPRQRLRRYRRRADAKLTVAQLRAAYQLHTAGGLSLHELGRRLYARYGYASAHSCAQALVNGFQREGWPARERVEATRAAHLKHGRARKGANRDPTYKRWLREQRGTYRPACKGRKTTAPGRGRPCQHPAMAGSEYCWAHDPARKAEREAQVARMRERLPQAA